MKPVYHRQSRTLSSEQYQILDGDQRLGHLDLHFGANEVFGTLVLGHELPEPEITRLIEQIDDDLVMSAEVPREDFMIRVFLGREVGMGFYSDEILQDDIVGDGHEEFEEE
jgi:hypothetical protein